VIGNHCKVLVRLDDRVARTFNFQTGPEAAHRVLSSDHEARHEFATEPDLRHDVSSMVPEVDSEE